jgi:hypothetical protein
VPTIVNFSLHDVLSAAEQIIKADKPTSLGEVWTLEDEIALILRSLDVSTHNVATATRIDTSEPFVLNHTVPQASPDASGLVVIGLFILLVAGSIMLVQSYFHSTFGV